jgi:hypothetical protein
MLKKDEATCVNCHLATKKIFTTCRHCSKPWNIAVPVSILTPGYKKPTQEDIAAYNLWLQKEIGR